MFEYDPTNDRSIIARHRSNGWNDARILSALGHPGYGETYASAVLDAMLETSYSAHEVIYGISRWGAFGA